MRLLWMWLFLVVLFPCASYANGPEVFAGKVVDPAGTPVAGATVWLTADDWSEPIEPKILAGTETAQDGAFRFAEIPPAPKEPGWYNVAVHKEGWAFAWTGRMWHTRRHILLTLRKAFPLQGRITGPYGKPVAGVEPIATFLVHPGFDPLAINPLGVAFSVPPALSKMMATPTDEAGRFVIRNVPPGTDFNAKIRDQRFAGTYFNRAWRDFREARAVEIALEPPGTIRGRVLNAGDGKPRPGVRVGLFAGGTTTTDAEGQYEFTGLRPGVYRAYLREMPAEFTAKATGDIKLEPGATVENVNLLVERGASIRGRVTAQGTGEPIAGAGICCNTQQQPWGGSSWPIMKTGPDGRYSLQAPEGPAELRPFGMPEGWIEAIPYNRIGHDRRLDVSAKHGPIEVNFEATPSCALSGMVLDAKGQPAGGATVVLQGEDLVSDAALEADDAGRFEFKGLRPGAAYMLRAHRGDDMTIAPRLATAGGDAPVSLRLQAGARPTVSGRAVGEEGTPASYALMIVSARDGQQARALADEQGRFVVRCLWPVPDTQLRIQAGGYAEQQLKVGALAPGEKRDLGEMKLAIANLVVTGRVVKPDGSPMAGITVDAEHLPGRFSRRFMATTDLQGRFRIEGLPREELYVMADRFECYSTPQRVGPGKTEANVTAIPWDELILERHVLATPLEQKGEGLTATLRGLYRARPALADAIGDECLALDVESDPQPGWRGWMPAVRVSDDRGRPLPGVQGRVEILTRALQLVQLPEADAQSLTIQVGQEVEAQEAGVVFDALKPMTPMKKDRFALVLGKPELTDEWIPGDGRGRPDPKLPPYVRVMLYALSSRALGFNLGPVRAHDGPELTLRNTTSYVPGVLSLACILEASPPGKDGAIASIRPMRYGPAWVAGIREGDRLLSYDGMRSTNLREAADYFRARPVGTKVVLHIRRGREELDVPVVAGKWDEKFEAEAQQALLMLQELAPEAGDARPIGCYELQSTAHGPIALPEAFSITLTPRVRTFVPAVTFEDVPVPAELRRR